MAVSVDELVMLACRRFRRHDRALIVSGVYAFVTPGVVDRRLGLWQHGPSLARIEWCLVLVDRWRYMARWAPVEPSSGCGRMSLTAT